MLAFILPLFAFIGKLGSFETDLYMEFLCSTNVSDAFGEEAEVGGLGPNEEVEGNV